MKGLNPSIAVIVLSVVLTACQTDRERYKIGFRQPVTVPVGLFPEGGGLPTLGRGYAGTLIGRKFGPEKDMLAKDPVLTFKMLALFEWFMNDLTSIDMPVPPHKMRELLDVRDDLRDMLSLPRDVSTSEAIGKLYSMSKFMGVSKITSKSNSNEPEEFYARRELITKYKGKVTALMKRLARNKNEEQPEKEGKAK